MSLKPEDFQNRITTPGIASMPEGFGCFTGAARTKLGLAREAWNYVKGMPAGMRTAIIAERCHLAPSSVPQIWHSASWEASARIIEEFSNGECSFMRGDNGTLTKFVIINPREI